VRLLRFTGDGSALVVYGVPDSAPDGDYPTASTALLDVSDLSMIWEQKLEQVKQGAIPMDGTTGDEHFLQYLEPAIVYSPLENSLYAVHADHETPTRVDFTTRQVSTVEIRPRMSWIESFLALFTGPAQAKAANGTRKQAVLSPDGKNLYVVATHDEMKTDQDGNFSQLHELLGLQVLDPDSGEELGRYETGGDDIGISPDGASLFLSNWGWSEQRGKAEVISTKDMSIQAGFDNQQFLVTLSPAGKPHLLLLKYGPTDTELSWLDWDSLQPTSSWKVNGYPILVRMP
jgi:hypothetical protein